MAGAEQLINRTCEFLLAGGVADSDFWQSVLKNLGPNVHYLGEVGKATMAESPMIYGSMFVSVAAAYSVAVGLKLGVPHEIIKSQLMVFGPSMEPMITTMLQRSYDSPMATTESFLGAC
jgi:3-hydroxyisobutyrate dehydrogenase-like beta-hydroxyacid dehydrogenase